MIIKNTKEKRSGLIAFRVFNPWRTDIVTYRKATCIFSITNSYEQGVCMDFDPAYTTIKQAKREFTTFLKRRSFIKRLYGSKN
jgi:hypothetical protein